MPDYITSSEKREIISPYALLGLLLILLTLGALGYDGAITQASAAVLGYMLGKS